MKLLADENMPQPVLTRLASDGWEILAMSELAPGVADDVVISRAHTDGLVLVTQDRDFGELAIAKQIPVSGVVLVELERLSLTSQADRLSECLARERDNLTGNFLVVEPRRVRRRRLPTRASGGQNPAT